MDEKLFKKVCFMFMSTIGYLIEDPTLDDIVITKTILDAFSEDELKIIEKLSEEHVKQEISKILEDEK